MARPAGSPNKDKPFRDALRMAISESEGDSKVLRKVADALVSKAKSGDVQAIKEIADRLDGKVPQSIAGPDGEGPLQAIFTVVTGVPRAEQS